MPLNIQVPDTRMNKEEAEALVSLLQYVAPNIGWSISRPMEPVGSSPIFGAYSAIVALPGGGRGEASADNPSIAFRLALANAHINIAATIISPSKAADAART